MTSLSRLRDSLIIVSALALMALSNMVASAADAELTFPKIAVPTIQVTTPKGNAVTSTAAEVSGIDPVSGSPI